MNDGTLERAEMDRLRNRAKRSVKAEIRGKREARRTEHARRYSRERECGQHDGNRSFGRGGNDRRDDRDRRDDDRRRDAHRRSGREGRDRHDNQPKRGDRDGGSDRGTRRDGDGRGATAGKKPWSTSATKKGRDDRDRRESRDRHKVEAHHNDARRTSSDEESPDDREDTEVNDNNLRSAASSNVDDNFAVAMAPLAKRAKTIRGSTVAAKETAPAHKRKAAAPIVPHVTRKDRKDRCVIKSDNSNNNNDEAFLASCDKALKDPLDIK